MGLKGKTSLNVLVERMEILYENIFNLLVAFQKATNTKKDEVINVTIKNDDGTESTVPVNSFQRMLQDIERIDSNFKAITNKDNLSYILNSDGTLSQYTKTSFINSPYIDVNAITIPDTCSVDNRSMIAKMIYPMVNLPISIDSSYVQTKVIARIFNITTGYDTLPEHPTYLQLQTLIKNGSIISDNEMQVELDPVKEQVKYFGMFDIKKIDVNEEDYCDLYLNDIHYTGLNVNGNNIELKVNDILVTKTGASKWKIDYIEIFNNYVKLSRVSGIETLTTSSKLMYNQVVDGDNLVVGVPVKPQQDLVVFLSSESLSAVSYPSDGIKLSTTDYKVSYNGSTYTIDEFFSDYVTNIADYLMSIIDDNTIPFSLGIQPNAPELLAANFKVVQINKHITNSTSVQNINKLNADKQNIQNQIDSKQAEIEQIKANIQSNFYTTETEKKSKQKYIADLETEITTLNSNILAISRKIDAFGTENNDTKAKYKVVGFWPIQNDLYSTRTGVQKIVKYEVQYRYLSANSDNIENTTINMVENGNEVSVVFSAWNNLETAVLTKVKNIDGSTTWQEQSISSVDDININQCMVTINENESIQIRVRAISEAGYPIMPLKSEWSNVIRVDFPDDLKQNTVSSIVEQNTSDLRNAEFRQILTQLGVIEHLGTRLIDNDVTFSHEAKYITSGLYTDDMRNIPLDTAIKQIRDRIDTLESKFVTKPLRVSIIDFNNDEYEIGNNQSIDIFAGYVGKEYDVNDPSQFGKIITKKAYIKIKNPNSVSVDIKTLQPIGMSTLDGLFIDVPVSKNSREIDFSQETGQIVYFRNTDLSLSQNFPIYKDYSAPSLTDTPTSTSGSDNAYIFDPTMTPIPVYVDDTMDKLAAVSINTPATLVTQALKNAQLYNNVLASEVQLSLNNYPFDKIGFLDTDKYNIGRFTCGAFFYPVLGNIDRMKVKGNASTSVYVMSAGEELLIPIIFEYRMFDALGRMNGEIKPSSDIVYKKTLGVSMNIDNLQYTFDINAYTKL